MSDYQIEQERRANERWENIRTIERYFSDPANPSISLWEYCAGEGYINSVGRLPESDCNTVVLFTDRGCRNPLSTASDSLLQHIVYKIKYPNC